MHNPPLGPIDQALGASGRWHWWLVHQCNAPATRQLLLPTRRRLELALAATRLPPRRRAVHVERQPHWWASHQSLPQCRLTVCPGCAPCRREPLRLSGLGGLTRSDDGALEEFDEFLESLATSSVSLPTWARSPATCCSSSAIRRS